MAAGLRRRGGAVGPTRRGPGPGRHRPEHDRRAGADRHARSATGASPRDGRGGPVVILDIAVPRDFDPAHPRRRPTFLFNIDDLKRIREQTLADRRQARRPGRGDRRAGGAAVPRGLGAARQRPGDRPADGRLRRQTARQVVGAAAWPAQRQADRRRQARHRGGVPAAQNQFLHGPISALGEASREGGGSHTAGGAAAPVPARRLRRFASRSAKTIRSSRSIATRITPPQRYS